MKPLFLTAALAVAASAADVGTPEYLKELDAFNHAYSRFYRDIMGCPAKATDVNDCNPKLGLVNRQALEDVIAQAPRIIPMKQDKRKRRWWFK